MKLQKIDHGKAFDWGRTSQDYAKYRDIYPESLYQKIISRGIGLPGQKILDIGTGTGVLPRNLYAHGAEWTGIDLSENQIAQAKQLARSQNQNITFRVMSANALQFPEQSFDAVTACQCFWYFDPEQLFPTLRNILKPDGKILILQMCWLPYEDEVAMQSEQLVLKYNPEWTGAGETRKPVFLSEKVLQFAELVFHEEYEVQIPFTRTTWNGRMKACRGIGASLPDAQLKLWEQEHLALLSRIAPEQFSVLHYIALAELKLK